MKLSIKKISIYSIGLYTMLLISLLSYEIHLYRSIYQMMIISIFAIGSLLMFFSLLNRKKATYFFASMGSNLLLHLLSISLLISTFLSLNVLGLITFKSLFYTTITMISLYVFFVFMPVLVIERMNQIKRLLIFVITTLSIIAILITLFGSFLGYTPQFLRAASIYFDPNYFGTLSAIGVVLSLYSRRSFKLMSAINFIALVFSGSRAAMLSLLIVLIVAYFYTKKLSIKRIMAFTSVISVIGIVVVILLRSNFFRTYQGLSGRDNLWSIAIELINEALLWGYGYGGGSFQARGINISSHNYYLDFMIMYGVPSFILLMLVVIKALRNGIKHNVPKDILQVVLLLLINANSIVISVGGLGALSLILTLFLGVCNSYGLLSFNHIYGCPNKT